MQINRDSVEIIEKHQVPFRGRGAFYYVCVSVHNCVSTYCVCVFGSLLSQLEGSKHTMHRAVEQQKKM